MYNFKNSNRQIKNIPNEKVILPNNGARTITLFSQPYLDTYNGCYRNIVVTNLKPMGPLSDFVRIAKFPKLSEFKQDTPCNPLKTHGFVLMSIFNNYGYGCCGGNKFGENYMSVDEVPNLISFLFENGYIVDTSISKMFNTSEIRFDTNSGSKLICFVTYTGE